MASDITEVDQFDATVAVFDDGDTANRASMVAPLTAFQALSNRTKYLHARTPIQSGGVIVPATHCHPSAADNPDWVYLNGHLRDESTNLVSVVVPLPFLAAGTITGFTAFLTPAGAHGALPATLPVIALFSQKLDGSGSGTIASVTDTSGSVGAYELAHTIVSTGLTETVDGTEAYFMLFTGEGSTNSLVNLLFHSASLQVTF